MQMIGFVDGIRSGFAQYLNARGRASRAEYWWWWLMMTVLQLFAADGPLGALLLVVLFLPSVTVLVRRLHDTGRSAWTLLVVFIPLAGFFILLYLLVQPGDPMANRYGPPRVATGRTGDGWAGWQDGGGWGGSAGGKGPGRGPGQGPGAGWDDVPPPPGWAR